MVRIHRKDQDNTMSSGLPSQQFCVRWNSHLGSLGAAFPQLLAGQRFVDVTLACEGHQVHCHRLVLAACSSYFESLLGENPCKHPIIILPHDIKLWEIQALVDFMYKGEVNVSQEGLSDLLKCAEALQIRGLCGSDAALNLNQITTNVPPTGDDISSSSSSQQTNKNVSSINIGYSGSGAATHKIMSVKSESTKEQIVFSRENTSTPKPKSSASAEVVPEKTSTRKDNSAPTSPMTAVRFDDGDESVNESNSEIMDDMELKINEEYSDDNSVVKIEPEQISDITIEHDSYSDHHHHHNSRRNSSSSLTSQCGKIRVKSNENLLENYKSHHPSDYNSSLINNRRSQNKSVNKNVRIKHSSFRGMRSDAAVRCDNDETLPSSLKFNKNAMTIFVRQQQEQQRQQQQQQHKRNQIHDNSDLNETDLLQATDNNIASTSNNVESFENIICSPNFIPMSYNDENGDDGFNCEGNVDYNDSAIDMSHEYNDGNDESRLMMNENNIGDGDEIVIEDPMIDRKPTFLPPLIPLQGDESEENLPSKRPRDHFKDEVRKMEKIKFQNLLLNGCPPPNSFVLRNPRGNQPRTYNTDSLWAALMDVKAGESIYRASQVHKVPRKTLRNWMKRWDIKSSYPMPRQLRQAAEKRKVMSQEILKNVSSASDQQRSSEEQQAHSQFLQQISIHDNPEQQTQFLEQMSLHEVHVTNSV